MIHCELKILSKLTRCLSGSSIEQVAALIGRQEGDDYIVMGVLSATNEDEDPAEKFYVSKAQLEKLAVQASQKGCFLLGIAHSHLPHHPAYPSMADIRYCRHMVNAVYHPTSHSLTWFNNKGALASLSLEQRPTVFTGMERLFASV